MYYRQSLAFDEELAEETGTVGAYEDLAVSYYKLAVIRQPYNLSLLKKALQIYTKLSTQCPQVERYSANADMIKDIFRQRDVRKKNLLEKLFGFIMKR